LGLPEGHTPSEGFDAAILRTDWRRIRSVRTLKRILMDFVDKLYSNGYPEIADDWRERISKMPSQLSKEGINAGLLAMCVDVQARAGIKIVD